jgi:BirA family biotin operon repressor/biotin-[acetyl-CoA-carboxylase] ligase
VSLNTDHQSHRRDWFGLGEYPLDHNGVNSLYLLDTVGSTNEFLRGQGSGTSGRLCRWDGQRWQAGVLEMQQPVVQPCPGIVVVSRLQTAGRGRQGRSWVDCGGLNLSFAVDPMRAAVAQGFSVWLGLIVTLVLQQKFSIDARLKWPNDILVRGRKIGGILVQRNVLESGPVLIAGVGLNLDATVVDLPAGLESIATSFRIESGKTCQPAEVAAELLGRVEADLDLFSTEGWSRFRSDWRRVDALVGRHVSLVAGEETHAGEVVGLSDSGALMMKLSGSGEEMLFHAGEVHILPNPDGWGEE